MPVTQIPAPPALRGMINMFKASFLETVKPFTAEAGSRVSKIVSPLVTDFAYDVARTIAENDRTPEEFGKAISSVRGDRDLVSSLLESMVRKLWQIEPETEIKPETELQHGLAHQLDWEDFRCSELRQLEKAACHRFGDNSIRFCANSDSNFDNPLTFADLVDAVYRPVK